MEPPPLTHFWWVRKTLPERKGQPCRVIARGRGPGPRNIMIEFADGYRVVTHRHAVRRLPAPSGALKIHPQSPKR